MTATPGNMRLNGQFDIDIDVSEREIRVFGEVDIGTAPLLTSAVMSLLTATAGPLTLDLGGVTFGDSALLNAIETIRGDLHGGELRLINPTPAVKRLFLAGGLAELLRIEPED
jgi:anti-anti-sigma factor